MIQNKGEFFNSPFFLLSLKFNFNILDNLTGYT